MTAALAQPLADDDRLHLDFALGKAFADRGEPATAFGHYAAANARRAAQLRYDAAETTRAVARARAFFTAERLARVPAAIPPPTRSSSSACRARARR